MGEGGDDKITQDRGLKALFAAYPQETFETFAPEVIAERGRPASIVAVGQEIGLPDLGHPNRFLDMALLATWADGRQILLIEHWSTARDIDWRRITLYISHLLVQHPQADVLPVLLVTDPSAATVSCQWRMPSRGPAVLTVTARVVRPAEADVLRLQALQNRVAAALLTLAALSRGRVEATAMAVRAFAAAPGSLADLNRFLPFLETLAGINLPERAEYRRRLIEDPTMPLSVIEELMAEREAKGEAKGLLKGKAEGEIAAILHMVSKGRATREAAKAEILDLCAEGVIDRTQADAALVTLGRSKP